MIVALFLAATAIFGAPADALECPPLVEETAAKPAPFRHHHGLLWRLTAPDGHQSVILGTMHVSDPRVLEIRDAAQAELERSDVFVMEVVLDPQGLAKLQHAMTYDDGRNLSAVVGADVFGRTAARMLRYGIAAAQLETLKPWAAYITLSLPSGQFGPPLDLLLQSAAEAAGKPVIGLESVDDQIKIFESVSESDQIGMLHEVACHYATFQAQMEQMITRYAARDLQGLTDLSFQYADEHREVILDALLWQRNDHMVERLIEIFRSATAFVAVGALHLAGPRGILQQLEQRGFVAEAIE